MLKGVLAEVRKILIRIGRPWFWLIKRTLSGIKYIFRIRTRVKLKRLTLKVKPVAIIAVIILLFSGSWFYWEIIRELPDVNNIYKLPQLSTKIYDRNGKLLYKFFEDENRSWVPLGKIPESLIQASLAIEDKNFYKHKGVSLVDIAKAGWYDLKNLAKNKVRGGSTLTQQLVKNVFLGREKTWKRKIKEAVLAIILENKLSKDEILERYFNQVAYGGSIYGVGEAAEQYFGKKVWEINSAEAAYLAGLPAAPSSYYPFGPHPEMARERQLLVIREMVEAGFINQQTADELAKRPLEIKLKIKDIKAAHFVFYVKEELKNNYGYDQLERQGLEVVTTLDSGIQQLTEEIIKDEVDKVTHLRISNGAGLVVDVKRGEILAMAGSKDYNASDIDGKYNVTTALRQPGSSIKPINYLLAMMRGKSLSDTIEDSPVTYEIKGQKPYSPKNYNGKYMGRVTLKTALASSLNVPSVKLLDENGVDSMIDLAELMGIKSWPDRSRYGLSLALGSGEVKMTELATAYSTLANLGVKKELNSVLTIKNYLGETIYEKKDDSGEKVIDPGMAFLINKTLADNLARAPIFGTQSKLIIPGKTVAVKTGTTNSLRDNWCVGWTASYLVAAWVGNNNNLPMSWVASGVSGATPIWNRIMSKILEDKANEDWEMPDNVVISNKCGKEELELIDRVDRIKCPYRISPSPSSN